ncbi:hypothetical protein [Methylocapsa acidiphila]
MACRLAARGAKLVIVRETGRAPRR